MRIQQIAHQHRRDFVAIYECEHCGYSYRGAGYDDAHFHRNVIPLMACPACGETASADYRPLEAKYPEHVEI